MGTDSVERRSHWSQLEERGVILGIRTMLLAYRVLGRVGFLVFLYPVIFYFFLANGEARRASRDFLTRVHHHAGGGKPVRTTPGWRNVYRHLFAFGEAVLDKLAAWTGKITHDTVTFENLQLFLDLVESKRGGLIIASHLGNAEVSRALGSLILGSKINVLVHTKHSAKFNKVMRETSPESTISLIQVTEVDPAVAMMLSEKVAMGEFVVIVGDRTPVEGEGGEVSSRVSWVEFLGSQAPFPQGPFILAGLLKCPVQTMFCLKREGRYHIIFEHFADVIDIPRRARGAALDLWVERYARRLESYCLTDPYQWFNFFDFWSQAGTASKPDLTVEAPKNA